MSRTPEDAESIEGIDDYTAAFRTVFRMHEKGKSFSGREKNCVFLNTGEQGGGRFADISSLSGFDFADDGRGLALVDWDHDGDLDLWASNRTAPRLRFLRNNTVGESSVGDPASISLRLIGRRVNRDAVGARVEVLSRAGNQPQVLQSKTLRAGQGFLSQSSRWLHFGLAERTPLEVRITWPDGQRQVLRDLHRGRYEITQSCVPGEVSCSEVQPRSAPARDVRIVPEALAPAPPRSAERVFMTSRAPLPILPYEDLWTGQMETVGGGGPPTLINLWASWCLPCVAELKELSLRWPELRQAGLEIVALSVDGLDESKSTNADNARRFLAQQPVPFSSGLAGTGLLDRLQIFLDRLFSKQFLLAVPTSLLLDGEGNLAALYRGPVSPEQVLEDLSALGLDSAGRRQHLMPFGGRWVAEPGALRLTTIAQRFLAEGYPEDALRYLQKAIERRPGEAELLTSLGKLQHREGRLVAAREAYIKALSADPTQAEAAKSLGDLALAAGELRNAVTYFRQALAAAPDLGAARFNLANALQGLGDRRAAMEQYRAVLKQQPDLVGAHNNLGALLLQEGQPALAREHLERALELDATLADGLINLGILALNDGAHSIAIDHFERAVLLRPGSAAAHNNLGVALLRAGLPDRAIASFETALRLRPEFKDARDNLALARAKQ